MTVAVETGLWQLDPTPTTVAIKHKTMWGMVTVKGTFTGVAGEGEVQPDGTAPTAPSPSMASLDAKNASGTSTSAPPTSSTPTATRRSPSPSVTPS